MLLPQKQLDICLLVGCCFFFSFVTSLVDSVNQCVFNHYLKSHELNVDPLEVSSGPAENV